VKVFCAASALSVVLVACADAPGPGREEAAGVPDVAEIVCEADGSTTVRTPQVVVQPDGVHVHVLSQLDETASLNGFGFDVDTGETTQVDAQPPGVVEEACWPFSRHGGGDEPPTTPIEILDPHDIYVEGELQCSGTSGHMIGEFAEAPLEGRRVPLEAARSAIRGIDDDDEVFHVGYPEQRDARVAVRRDGQIVATFGFVTFDGNEWVIEDSSICSSADLEGAF